jgi:hypothetical protein
LVSVVAALSVVSMLASTASAKIKFEWKVGGAGLAAGATRGFTSSTDGKTLAFASSVLGTAILLLSNKVTVDNGKIIGGIPGKNLEKVLFENVTVASPANCTAETGGITNPTPGRIETENLLSEIVEGQTSKEPLILFRPETGTTFVQIKLLGASCGLAGQNGKVEGSVLAEPLPSLTETLNGNIDFEASNKEFLLSSGGAADKAGLTFFGSGATLTGLLLNVLTTDEKYGAF